MVSIKFKRDIEKEEPTIQDLQREINEIKDKIKELYQENKNIKTELLQGNIYSTLEEQNLIALNFSNVEEKIKEAIDNTQQNENQEQLLNYVSKIQIHKWLIKDL